jgi:cytochrome c-type biogenesis protein CcmH
MLRRKISALRIIALFLLILTTGLTAYAQGEEPTDDEVNAIAKQLYCPVCENVPLDVCPTKACSDWRDEIRQKLIAGWTEEEIKQYFVEQHGAQVLSTPPLQGLYWTVYVLPPLAFLVGGVILFRVIRAWRAAPEEQAADVRSPAREQDPYVERVEEELRRRY